MTQALLIGYAPDSVDFSDLALMPGLDANKVAAGIEAGLWQMRDRGWEAAVCSLPARRRSGPDGLTASGGFGL